MECLSLARMGVTPHRDQKPALRRSRAEAEFSSYRPPSLCGEWAPPASKPAQQSVSQCDPGYVASALEEGAMLQLRSKTELSYLEEARASEPRILTDNQRFSE